MPKTPSKIIEGTLGLLIQGKLWPDVLELIGFRFTETATYYHKKKVNCIYCTKPITKSTIAVVRNKPFKVICRDPLCLTEYFEDYYSDNEPTTEPLVLSKTKTGAFTLKHNKKVVWKSKSRRKNHGKNLPLP